MEAAGQEWLRRIRELPLPPRVRVMNVCGGHERTIAQAGLRSLLPPGVELIPGPGCPVCVCPEEDILAAMTLALDHGVMLTTFGDMLRVPVLTAPGQPRSLEQARAAGGEVIPLASPLEALALARQHPHRQVVFFAVGFETTMAPVAALLAQGTPDNLSLLLSGRLTRPAVALLLSGATPGFEALVAPGHVATIAGPEEWAFVAQRHGLPVAVAGFTPERLLRALWSVLRQVAEGRLFLDNCYPEVVRPGGNPGARRLLETVFTVRDAPWRGLGVLPASGYALAPAFACRDARLRFPRAFQPDNRRHRGEMPPGCACAQVVLGRVTPLGCRLYGSPCTPRHPVGPCMVSDEGACRIWWSSGRR
ncbi:MAG: hydrogenase formation protein HypD [Magnetococcales bacterium]|nr:hydrogenase formation protein HypD [Magnetococcales bacterium]